VRIVQVRKLDSLDAFRAHVHGLGVSLPIDDEVDAAGPLAQPVTIDDGSAGPLVAPNRFAILPMEGWDGGTDGRPSELVRRRWGRFGRSGAGLVWGEATAVRPDGRANPNQLVLDRTTVDDIADLRGLLAPEQVAGLQLTHSGRFSRPHGTPVPRVAYRHPYLDDMVGAGPASVLSDDELDELVDAYVDAAVLAADAGFDFVDVKHCHGYLLHELLSAVERPGRYGGDLDGRLRFLRSVVERVRRRVPGLAVAVRLSVFDCMPFVAGAGGVGRPVTDAPYAYAFGGDGTGLGIDLGDVHRVIDALVELGIGLVSTTAGSPYYCPHVQRPAYFPPSDGYQPPEDPLVGVARQLSATAEVCTRHPSLIVVGSGYTYLQEWLPRVAQAVVRTGGASMVGLGRMSLAHPELPADVLAGRPPTEARICRTFSDCTTAPRHGLVSGCFPLDPFYKGRPERVELARAKREARARLG
jgi:2,4-dienoyl-CoA reductase-like NADH-dependent reductase (Old Yellow Enzyme family)